MSDANFSGDEASRGWDKFKVSNAIDETVFVEVDPIETVRRDKARGMEFSVGADAAAGQGGAHAKMKVGEVSHVRGFTPSLKTSVCAHQHGKIPIPGENISKVHTEKAARCNNSISLRLYTGKDADRKEIEDGFTVGPGQGLIVSRNAGGVLNVGPAQRSWHNSSDTWIDAEKTNRDPHDGMEKREKCEVCGFTKR